MYVYNKYLLKLHILRFFFSIIGITYKQYIIVKILFAFDHNFYFSSKYICMPVKNIRLM